MDLLPYMELFFGFVMHEYLNGLWIAGIGMAAILLVLHLLCVKRWM